MKVLVAYDGSRCSEAALDGLARTGLPDLGEAIVISIAEAWLPPKNGKGAANWELTGTKLDRQTLARLQKHYESKEKSLAEPAILANHAKERLQKILPGWKVKPEATYGSPAREILERAEAFKPDLIVAGSHGHSEISRFFLGSISQKVLTEAPCSVRVARECIEVDPTAPVRVLIGFDGSKKASAAVETVAERRWPNDSEFRLITATEDVTPTAIDRFFPPVGHMAVNVNESERRWIEIVADGALKRLRSSGTSASLHIRSGNPKEVLIREAEHWNADCIFVGANSFGSRVERFLLGSTSAAVACRANCSVEVVRKKA